MGVREPLEGSYVLSFRLWLALRIMPNRAMRMYARALAHLTYEERLRCYWQDKHWTESVIRKEVRRQEVYDVLGPPPAPMSGEGE